jgi:hypothetical protein
VLRLLALLSVIVPWFPHVNWLRAAAIVATITVAFALLRIVLSGYLTGSRRWFVRLLGALPFLGEQKAGADDHERPARIRSR